MHRLRSIISSLVLVGGLALLVLEGNRSLGLTAVIALGSLTAASAFQTTLQSWLASGQLTSESYVRRGAIVVVVGPDGPFIGKVIERELRVTVLENEDASAVLVVPNALLTAGAVRVLVAWPVPVVAPVVPSN